MKLSELVIGTDYAVVPSWTYNNKSARDVSTVRENDVVKGTLVSLEKYEYQASQRTNNPADFTKAQAGNRSVGVLIKAFDSNSQKDIYWTSRLADIIAVYADLEPKWASAKAQQEEQERQQQEKWNKVEIHKQSVNAEIERSRNSITQTSRELLGDKTFVEVSTEGYDLDYKGVVKLSIDEFEQLIEMAYQGKAQVA